MPLGAILPFLPAIASGLGGLLGGRTAGRQQAANQTLLQNQAAMQAYQVQQQAIMDALRAAEAGQLNRAQLDLLRRTFSQQAPTQRGMQAVRGDYLANAQPIQISHPRATIPQISGGFGPGQFSPETRQLGQEMSRQALMQQLEGDNFEPIPMTNFTSGLLPPPQLGEMPSAGALDKILGIAAPIASIAGGITTVLDEQRERAKNQEIIDQLLNPPETVAGEESQEETFPNPPVFAPQLPPWMGAY